MYNRKNPPPKLVYLLLYDNSTVQKMMFRMILHETISWDIIFVQDRKSFRSFEHYKQNVFIPPILFRCKNCNLDVKWIQQK